MFKDWGWKTKDWVGIALVGGLAWYVIHFLSKEKDKALDNFASAYAAMTNWLRGSVKVVPLGSVFLPNQTWVPVSQLVVRMIPNTDTAQFTYQGQRYLIKSGHDENGNWAAIKG